MRKDAALRLLPGTMMAAVTLPVGDADTVSLLRLMNPDIAVGRLTDPYDPDVDSIRIRNIFGPVGSHGRMFVLSMTGRPLYLPQRTTSGQIVIATVYDRGDSIWRKTIIAQLGAKTTNVITAAMLPDDTCHHAQVLRVADRVLAEIRDLVITTPIRI